MSFNTGNPIGSISEEDCYDNMANLDRAMNSTDPTWRDRFNVEKPTIDAALKSTGFMPAGFDFVTGGTLQPGDRNKAVYNPAPNGDNNWYRWNGVFPKEIAANSQPNPKDENNWVPVIIKTDVIFREALRRTYQEVGLNLVDGSFEQGGTLNAATDVLLEEKTGKCYSFTGSFPHIVSRGTKPESSEFRSVDTNTLYEQLGYAVVDRYFLPGETSWADAISRARTASRRIKFLPGKTYNCEGAVFQHPSYQYTAEYDFTGAIIEGSVRFQGAYNTKFIGGVFTGKAYFQNVRFSKFDTITFNCPCYFGYYDFGDSVPTYSLYWNNFDTVIFNQGFELNSSIERASFNSNTFINTVFRAGAMNATMVFKVDPTTGVSLGATFGSNTFIGCDWSYAPALDIKGAYKSFSMSIVGGYLDTGSVWLAPGSWEPEELSVTGLSNPGSQTITRKIGVNPVITTSGARKRAHIPVGSVNYVITEQLVSKINGTKTFSFYTAPLPYTGLYTVSTILETIGEGLFGSSITNTTQGTGAISGVVDGDGLNSFVFSANKGDVILIKLTSGNTTDVNLLQLAVTPGVGVVGPVPYRTAFPDDIYTANINTTPTPLASFSALQNRASYFDIEVTTRGLNVGYGGEKIKLSAAISAGATNINAYDLKEISRHTFGVNGGSITLSVTVSGLVVTLTATSSINGIPARVKVSSPNYAP